MVIAILSLENPGMRYTTVRNLMSMVAEILTIHLNVVESGPSTRKGCCEICAFCPEGRCNHVQAQMSCVTRAMTWDIGVVSSHLHPKGAYEIGLVPGKFKIHLRVVPKTDSISFRWIDLEALRAPNTNTANPTV